ncbi:glycosyltransferase [Salibacterium halotolerans]|uniref:Glycosyltransferase involved in cell wall bisynthesis n=1 Tax=Salibacterium halotolerans TaxID=1884432 RepID=A0A1I5XVY1_9BACI|nr:glycosyltransferase [Salibacterium halotolerans]SFQ36085.1 Glycosyltransferase involved in cell wall bisynthesis [Salibacterium halotolerans]
MKKKVIIYYPFTLIKNQTSGSKVRPLKILNAFKNMAEECGLEIIEISGTITERKKQLKLIYSFENPNNILFCYMENSTLPIWLTDRDHVPRAPFMELNFFRYLNHNSIPLGVFYRDAYWKFDNEYVFKGIKRSIMRLIYSVELKLLSKYASHVFLPSKQMNNYLNLNNNLVSSLPPAAEKSAEKSSTYKDSVTETTNLVYVGGINDRYGLKEMLEAVDIVNNTKVEVYLHLVCRRHEYLQQIKLIQKYLNKEWLKIYHAFENELEEIYIKADFGIIGLKKNIYNDFAVPVKLFEYISYCLPVVATSCNAQAEIIRNEQLGIVTEDNSDSLAEGILEMLDPDKRKEYKKNVEDALLKHHLWEHRVEQIYSTLVKD